MFKRILIATDFSEASRSAIVKGIQLARRTGAEVELIHVVSDLHESLRTAILGRGDELKWEAELETNLDLALPGEAYTGAKKKLIWGASVPGEILKHASQEKSQLVVCGSHGRGLLGRALLGSVAQELSRNSPIPVLIVPPDDQTSFSRGVERILVPIDFSLPSLEALDFAIRVATEFQSKIFLIHAIHLPSSIELTDFYPPMILTTSGTEELKAQASARLKRLAERRVAPDALQMDVLYGDAALEILQYAAEKHCSCIVMSSHGRKGLARAILGSVTTTVLARTKIPVFTTSPRS